MSEMQSIVESIFNPVIALAEIIWRNKTKTGYFMNNLIRKNLANVFQNTRRVLKL